MEPPQARALLSQDSDFLHEVKPKQRIIKKYPIHHASKSLFDRAQVTERSGPAPPDKRVLERLY
jgi:hypothetical protein